MDSSPQRPGSSIGEEAFQSLCGLLEEHFMEDYGNINEDGYRRIVELASTYISGIQIPMLRCPITREALKVKSSSLGYMQKYVSSNKFNGAAKERLDTELLVKDVHD